MKVVTPSWLVDSAAQGVLLNWHDYKYRPGGRVEDAQGRMNTQKPLFATLLTSAGTAVATTYGYQSSKVILNDHYEDARLDKLVPESPVSGEEAERSLTGIKVSQSTSTAANIHSQPTPPNGTSLDRNLELNKLLTSAPATGSETTGSPDHRLDSAIPTEPKQTTGVPTYAAHASNYNAQRVMTNPAWRAAHTSASSDFVAGYYRNSRLHHLSTWKAELRSMVQEAQERAESDAFNDLDRVSVGTHASGGIALCVPPKDYKEKGKAYEGDRVVMHCDFDSFFVTAGLLTRPELHGKPTVVCHSQGAQGGASSTSEIASASYEARAFGIKGGMRYDFQMYIELYCTVNDN
jgi:DNA repair protein REV1